MSEVELWIFLALVFACLLVALQLSRRTELPPEPVELGALPSKVVFWLSGEEEDAAPSGPFELTWLLAEYKAGALAGVTRVLVCDAEGNVLRETWLDALAAANAPVVAPEARRVVAKQEPATVGAGLAKAGKILTGVGGGLMALDVLVGGFAGFLSMGLLGIGVVLWVVGACLK